MLKVLGLKISFNLLDLKPKQALKLPARYLLTLLCRFLPLFYLQYRSSSARFVKALINHLSSIFSTDQIPLFTFHQGSNMVLLYKVTIQYRSVKR